MRVIFLDFDGVLNSQRYGNAQCTDSVRIDPTRMALVKQIVDATGAELVLSTSWREHWDADAGRCDAVGAEINRIFREAGLTILDKTPQLRNERDEEIALWLSAHPRTTAFVVIDDSPFEFGFLRGHFVLTSDIRDGLDAAGVRKAIRILTGRCGV